MAGNQYQVDPRQAEFLKNYLDPKSDTFANAYQSALKAQYSEEYAKNIMSLMPDWLSENIEDAGLVAKAIKNLNNLLDATDERVKSDMTKFTLERLHKTKYSTRQELTGANGKDLIPSKEEEEEASQAISNFLSNEPNTNNTAI